MMPACVAEVPNPVRSGSWILAKSSALAFFMADSRVSSVNRWGAFVAPSRMDTPAVWSRCSSESGGRGASDLSSVCVSFSARADFPSVSRNSLSSAFHPSAVTVRPLVEKDAPPQSSVRLVSS